MNTIEILELSNRGDARGFSVSPPASALEFVGHIADILLASLTPGAIRGNHYHLRKRQANIVLPGAAWSLHWDDGEGTAERHRNFEGKDAVLVLVPPLASHAVRNEGKSPLWLILCSSETYDPQSVVARKVL